MTQNSIFEKWNGTVSGILTSIRPSSMSTRHWPKVRPGLPRPDLFDIQRGTDPGNDFVGLGQEPALSNANSKVRRPLTPSLRHTLLLYASNCSVVVVRHAPPACREPIPWPARFSLLVTEQATSRLMLTFDTLASSSYLAPVYGDVVTQTYRFGGIHKVNIGASYRIPLKEFRAVRFLVLGEEHSAKPISRADFSPRGEPR